MVPKQVNVEALRCGVGLALLLVLTKAAPVAAHGGTSVYAGTAGPYFVEAYALRLSPNADEGVLQEDTLYGDTLDYTVTLEDQASRQPVEGAAVTVRVRTPAGELGPLETTAFGNQYQVLIPIRSAGVWTVEIDISGPAGAATVTHSLAVPPQAGWQRLLNGPLPFLLFSGATLAFVAGVFWRYRSPEPTRHSQPAGTTL